MPFHARKVFVLTGKRGGFGAMRPMLARLRDDDAFELQLVVTDQHVNARFGGTVAEIEREFEVAGAVDMEQEDDTPAARARAVGRCTMKMTEELTRLAPDLCVLYGDRGEVLATATAATLLGLPIAHLQGGDLSGSLDEPMRHAVTKLSHLHFPSTEESARRLRRMGEEDWRIQVVGDHHVDSIVEGDYLPPTTVADELDLDLEKPIIVVLQHSETTAPGDAHDQMTETLLAVRASDHQCVVVYPCSDQGYEGVIKAIEELACPLSRFRVRVNLDAPVFWGLLNIAGVMVGNSSAGLIETPYVGLPAVNVGRRQEDRLHAENVLHVPHDRGAIAEAIRIALENEEFRKMAADCNRPFGNGKSGDKVIDVLREIPLDRRLLVKRFVH
jgi:UDP-N-acetylglucosamine 2-epimerase (non-hydrolysing)/GDP/UDP-N,N'-diacetylbacillosamine 2-epimerase (hydrolysing)